MAVPGCAAVRANVGLGAGLGGHLDLGGLLHAGLMAGLFVETGTFYGDRGVGFSGYLSLPLGLHAASWGWLENPQHHHSCCGVVPPLTSGILGQEKEPHPWAFQLGLALLFVDVWLGLDPAALGRIGLEPEEPEPEEPAPSGDE